MNSPIFWAKNQKAFHNLSVMKPLTVRKFSYEYIQEFLDYEAFYFGKILSFLPFTEIFRIIGLRFGLQFMEQWPSD